MGVTKNDVQRAELVERAKLAEVAERYDDMAEEMSKWAALQFDSGVTAEEWNLFSVAFKSKVAARRNSWRSVTDVEHKSSDPRKKEMAREYRLKIEGEIKAICDECQTLLDNHLIPKTVDLPETRVFFMKMKGDYFRYVAETAGSNQESRDHHGIDDMILQADQAYHQAYELAEKLDPTNAIRLGLALNYSVFFYEIKHDTTKACSLANEAYENATPNLEKLDDASYKESAVILQLLRDNMTLWKGIEELETAPSEAAATEGSDTVPASATGEPAPLDEGDASTAETDAEKCVEKLEISEDVPAEAAPAVPVTEL